MSIRARYCGEDFDEEAPRFPVDDAFEWRRLFLLHGPSTPPTIAVLLVLCHHLNRKGVCCRPRR